MIVSRIIPGKDLKKSIEYLMNENNLKSGIIVSIVGSIDNAFLKMGIKKFLKAYLRSYLRKELFQLTEFTYILQYLMQKGLFMEDTFLKDVKSIQQLRYLLLNLKRVLKGFLILKLVTKNLL